MRLLKNTEPRRKKNLSPGEKARLAILSNRLKVTREEAERLLNGIEAEVASVLGIPVAAVDTGTEFAGRDLDLILTINKQNIPRKNQ
ncbi:MAG: hypothetical protein A2W80_16470 [Candidatus Riflebacteria bacterium GWC2_50_8]|nr:MAG: hypothetical protein A2W80_16470 [Candidatus Riflebacteria bacterium GWC2_50_8]